MADLWIVTSGCYSDYSVACAFTTQDLAEAYADHRNHAEWQRRSGPEWQFCYGSPDAARTYENYMADYGSDYGYRAECIQLWDSLPVAD